MRRFGYVSTLLAALGLWGCAKQSPSEDKAVGPAAAKTPAKPDVPAAEGPRLTDPGAAKPGATKNDQAAAPPEQTGPRVLSTSEIFTLPAADPGGQTLGIYEILAFLDDESNHEAFLPEVPLGLGNIAAVIPSDNPLTRAKVELGRQLYFDPRLSRDSTISCATCHDPAKGWAQDTPVATGIQGQKGGRNSPTVMNRAFDKTEFWDGRAASLEEQALGPIQNPIEMGLTLEEPISRLKGIEGYRIQFERVFSGDEPVSAGNVAKAIASFERTVLVGASPFDYLLEAERFKGLTPEDLADAPDLAAKVKLAMQGAEEHPMSESARNGRALFFSQRVGCSLCHVGSNLTDEGFFNIGVGMQAEKPDLGRVVVTKEEKDTGAFKTPTLRNVTLTAPYMHDGSEKTLDEVVEYYAKGGNPNPHLHERIKRLDLNAAEKSDLVAFMQALEGAMPEIPRPRLP